MQAYLHVKWLKFHSRSKAYLLETDVVTNRPFIGQVKTEDHKRVALWDKNWCSYKWVTIYAWKTGAFFNEDRLI